MKCSKCGNEIANDSVFCEFCGTKVENSKTILVRQNKQVDIRWCLLPAMLIISIAVGFVYDNFAFLSFLTIISTLLFLITLWYAIKKRIRLSFILIMGIMCLSHWYFLNFIDYYITIFFTCLFFSLLYIIYEIIANKRNWRF